MKVQFIGKINPESMAEKLTEVIESTVNRVQEDNDEQPKITGYELHDAEFTVKFNVEGEDDPQIMTVEHYEGYPEMFTWVVNTDTDEQDTNQEESMYDEHTVEQAKGEKLEFAEVKSNYKDSKLTKIDELSEEFDGMSKAVYEHEDGYRVARVFQEDKLIQEYKLIPKEEESE